MSDKTKRVTWQVIASIDGKQWPVGIETEVPAGSIQEMNEALESIALWFLKNNIYPQSSPSTSPPSFLSGASMPEKDAIPTLSSHPPDCPLCERAMTESKHQEEGNTVQYYCPSRFGNGAYCRWRGTTDPTNGQKVTWQVKKQNGGK